MDDSYESMDTSISPVRATSGGQKFGEKYDEGNNSPSPNVLQQQQWNEEEDGDIIIVGGGGSEADQRWDACIGVLENVLMDEKFTAAQEEFCYKHCHHFEATDENKLVYTNIYSQYTNIIETRIQNELTANIDNFQMEEFYTMLEERQGEICGDIWDMLMTIGDFAEFKNLMVAYKVQKEQMENNCNSGNNDMMMGSGQENNVSNIQTFDFAPIVAPVGRT